MNPPPLSDLMTRFLAASAGPAESGDVTPHEVLTAFRVDARTAWAEAKEAAALFGGSKIDAVAPPEWAAVVTWAETVAVPLALGNYPQMARDVGRLVAFDATPVSPAADADFPSLRRWAAKSGILGAALFRVIGRFEDAAEALRKADDGSTLHANESAALLFVRGDYVGAAEAWDRLPESPAAAFNRGLVRHILGDRETARTHLRAAIASLPTNSSWTDLARLYLAISETPGM
jgi:tetratricopeptide (TPR) repeat protein